MLYLIGVAGALLVVFAWRRPHPTNQISFPAFAGFFLWFGVGAVGAEHYWAHYFIREYLPWFYPG